MISSLQPVVQQSNTEHRKVPRQFDPPSNIICCLTGTCFIFQHDSKHIVIVRVGSGDAESSPMLQQV